MKLALWLFVWLSLICFYLADMEPNCQCSSNCKPKITVIKGGKSNHYSDDGYVHHKKKPKPPTCYSEAKDLTLWWCQMPGAPCYHLKYPNLPITRADWTTAYRYCRELGYGSRLAWYETNAEFDRVLLWIKTQFIMPITVKWLIWTSGRLRETIPIIPGTYYWNSTNENININRWSVLAQRNKRCVGQNPKSDFLLADADCDIDSVEFDIFGWICRRQPYSDC